MENLLTKENLLSYHKLCEKDRWATHDHPIHLALHTQVDFTKFWEYVGLPKFELPESAYGGTGYIDGLKPEDVDKPCKGKDRHGRRFIAIPIIDRKGENRVLVLFQRYSDNEDVWVSSGLYPWFNGQMSAYHLEVVKTLLENGEVLTLPCPHTNDDPYTVKLAA